MNYLKLATMEYALHEGDIRIEHPDLPIELTGDTFVPPEGYVLVTITPQPEITDDQYLTEDTPVEIDGEWRNVWVINDMTPEQIAARDEILNAVLYGRPITDVVIPNDSNTNELPSDVVP